MRVVAILGPNQLEVVDRPEPAAAGDIVVVKVLVAPMCTEFHAYRSGVPSDRLGHEAAGVVVDAGQSVRVKEGDRVVVMPQYGCGVCALCIAGDHIHCKNPRDVLAETGSTSGLATYAEYLLKPDWLLVPVPDDLQLPYAAMACCGLGPTFSAVRRLRLRAVETVVVSGCGPVGLGAIVNARAVGARVIAVEPQPYRQALALRLGAQAVVDPFGEDPVERIRELTGGAGSHAAIETSNTEGGPSLIQQVTRPRGRLALVSWSGGLNAGALVGAGHELHGCWHWNHQRYAGEMLETIRQSRPLLDRVITHTFPLERVEEAFQLQASGNCGKVLLYPHGAEAA